MLKVGDTVSRINPKEFWVKNFGHADLGPFKVCWVAEDGSRVRLEDKPFIWRSEYFVLEEKETPPPSRVDLSVWCK